MTLEEKILDDFKQAMKNKDSVRVSILSFLRAQFSYLALEKKKNALDDSDCLAVIKRLIKQHQDSIEQFRQGNREDLVAKEENELAVLKGYLPEELSAEDIAKLVDAAVVATGAAGMKDMGKVMKEVLERAAGRADNKTVSGLVRERLAKIAG
jgi:hypothetical protein